MEKNPLIKIFQFFAALWLLKWIFKIICFLLLLVFAILATPIWLIFKTKFNPWGVVQTPFA